MIEEIERFRHNVGMFTVPRYPLEDAEIQVNGVAGACRLFLLRPEAVRQREDVLPAATRARHKDLLNTRSKGTLPRRCRKDHAHGVGIACHLEIASPAHWLLLVLPSHIDGSFPIAGSEAADELLPHQRSRDIHL